MTQATPDGTLAQGSSTSTAGHILDTMISLTRTGPLHRVIIAGSDSMELYLLLRRRGFIRATTTGICRAARAQYAVGPIAGQISSRGIESILDQISPFLAPHAALALLVGSRENALRIRSKLEALGFRIEAGVRCKSGLVLSACRQGGRQHVAVIMPVQQLAAAELCVHDRPVHRPEGGADPVEDRPKGKALLAGEATDVIVVQVKQGHRSSSGNKARDAEYGRCASKHRKSRRAAPLAHRNGISVTAPSRAAASLPDIVLLLSAPSPP